ncbi:putative sterigmatocystin biosynthesis P450 monooxygenase STCB [Paramyrothecium foliicola]|nr:putative sterigmatocystin biosynthesis P450 monooxygenase STCB [Paramyrothecium foliicola]
MNFTTIKENGLLFVILAAGVACTLSILHFFSSNNAALRKIPGPFYANFSKLPLKYAVITGQRTTYIHHLHKRFGAVVRISPTEVSIVDPEASKAIHKAGSGYEKSDWYGRFTGMPVPHLFNMANPIQHGNRRKLFSRAFSKSEIRTKWEPMVKATTEMALDKITQELAGGKANFLKWWLFMATDISVHLMFGESFRTLETGKEHEYIRILQDTVKGCAIAEELRLIAFLGRRIPYFPLKNLFTSMTYLSVFGERAIQNSISKGKDGNSVFTQLETNEEPTLDHKGSRTLTGLDLSVEAGSFILAGTDTTAYTLTCLVWAVLSQPALQSALEEEVAGLDSNFRDSEVETLPLLNAVIKETLRLYGPSSSSLPRIVPKGGSVLGEYFIPQGTTVSTQAWTLQRNGDIWPQPEK